MKITEDQRKRIADVAARHGLDVVLLFGSGVTGREHALSDLDVAVRTTGADLGYSGYARLLEDLQEVFSGREVDLSFINHADPLFLKKILEHCELLYGDAAKLQELKIYAFKRYQDHRRFFEMERAYAKRFAGKAAAQP
jgi:predicted nucleotidyltransferase